MSRRSNEAGLWLLFSSGGMLAALLLPAMVFLLWVAPALGWTPSPEYGNLVGLARHPVVRLLLFALISLSLFHWAHRFRYTLYDGLQLYHLNHLIAVVTYGLATVLSLVAGYVVLTV